ncbi:MAG: peptidylprolyl isomerase [Candidatus Aenigmarchaeota archaeon]|nr:peptidylprolyl isomerase [Candidatus Aenigmarchaeota archaeon]
MREGDFVKVEYVGRVSDTNEIFDLTSEELAKKEGIHNPNYRYGPVLVIIGASMVIPGVEKKLKEMKLGREKEFDFEPEEGFGKRDVKRIKIISLANFIRQKINPVPGTFVEINGRQAKIQSVSGGRVRIDFNHPLAGKNLRYKVKIVEVIEKHLERVKAITDYYRLECELKLENGVLDVKTKETVQDIVRKILTDVITKWVKEVKKVNFSGGKEQKTESKTKEKTKKESK